MNQDNTQIPSKIASKMRTRRTMVVQDVKSIEGVDEVPKGERLYDEVVIDGTKEEIEVKIKA